MVVRVVGSLILLWNGRETPLDEEWSDMLATFRAQPAGEPIKMLVSTEGGAPSPAQQARMAPLMAGRMGRFAVLTDSVSHRFVASAMALFLRNIRTFAPGDLASAFAFLELNEEQRRAAVAFFRAQEAAP